MKRFVMIPLMALTLASVNALAHDEGHGPKITDAGKQGGIVSPVVDIKDIKKGAHAEMVYKAELVRSEDGTARVYFYNKDMSALDLTKLDKEAKGFLEFKKGKKWTKTPFVFKQEEGAFVAKAPKAATKPFNIDLHAKEGSRTLLTAFDNLD